MKPVTFRYNGKAGLPKEQKYVGVIAQDMQQIAPYMVGEFTYQDSTGKTEQYLDYDPNALAYILVNAVKEQQQHLLQKDQQIQDQQAQITALATRLARLEAGLGKPSPEDVSVARLYQNQPNPYGKNTLIKYFLPQNTTSAQLKIYAVTGQEVYSKELQVKGEGQVELSSDLFGAGTYIYHMFLDGKSVASKKLVLLR